MAESSQTQSTPPAEMHWGIAYLREDLQDLRQDMRHEFSIVHGRIDGNSQRIDRLETAVNQRIDSRFALLLGAMITMTGVILAAIKL